MKIKCDVCGNELEEVYFSRECDICCYCIIERQIVYMKAVTRALGRMAIVFTELTDVWGPFLKATQNDSKLAVNYKT